MRKNEDDQGEASLDTSSVQVYIMIDGAIACTIFYLKHYHCFDNVIVETFEMLPGLHAGETNKRRRTTQSI